MFQQVLDAIGAPATLAALLLLVAILLILILMSRGKHSRRLGGIEDSLVRIESKIDAEGS